MRTRKQEQQQRIDKMTACGRIMRHCTVMLELADGAGVAIPLHLQNALVELAEWAELERVLIDSEEWGRGEKN